MSRFRSPIAAAVLVVFASFSVNAASGPSVAVSILPLHSLVSSVMAGVSEPTLLIPRQVISMVSFVLVIPMSTRSK